MAKNTSSIVGLRELRENTEVYIRRVQKGESFIVARRSRPVFKLSPMDEADEVWETVIDFTEVNKNGVLARDVLKALSRMHGTD